MITKVTITGADDSIQPAQLQMLHHKYPFVEWGILLSKSQVGRHRFPSQDWLRILANYQRNLRATGQAMNLSGHLCGQWVRQILMGTFDPIDELPIWNTFSRIQLNTHADRHDYSAAGFARLASEFTDKEFIFQYDNVNVTLPAFARALKINYSVLFDLSHGAGVLASEWPGLIRSTRCGYAGGLSPQNLEEQIQRIEEKAGEVPIWIDMETHVRSDNDRVFDLDKVERCLEIASQYVQPAPVNLSI